MKTAGQTAGQKRQDSCTDSLGQTAPQTRAVAGFQAGQPEGQAQDCPDICPPSFLGGGQKDKRDTFAALVESIRRCTQVRGDTDANRDALIAEASDFTPEQQSNLAEHFDSEAERWKAL